MINRYKNVMKTLEFVSTFGEAEGWTRAAFIFEQQLEEDERLGLAYAALRFLPKEHIEEVAKLALGYVAGSPLPPLFSLVDEAEFWADMASDEELKVIFWACFKRLDPQVLEGFFRYIADKDAA